MSRFVEKYAHHFLWLISFGLILGFLLGAGFLGALGQSIQAQMQIMWALTAEWISRNADTLEKIGKLLGGAATLVGVAYSMVKGIYFAQKRLPLRLIELLRANDSSLLSKRTTAQGLIDGVRGDLESGRVSLHVGPLNRALGELKLGKTDAAYHSLDEALNGICAERSVANAKLSSLNLQAATAFVLRGAIHVAKAGQAQQDVQQARRQLGRAVQEFSQALDVRPQDVDALELRADARLRLGMRLEAVEDLKRLCAEGDIQADLSEVGLPIWQKVARAHRRIGDLEAERGFQNENATALENAVNFYCNGIRLLQRKAEARPLSAEEAVEFGRLCLAACKIFKHRGNPRQLADYQHLGKQALKDLIEKDREAATIYNGFH